MSALADINISEGNTVTGSDLRPNNLTEELSRKGAVIYEGHSGDNVPEDAGLVVRSTCIRGDNPEIARAAELGMPVISRGEMLRKVMDEYPVSLAVTGTHGKTTTSALAAHIAEHCGKDPTVIVGGEMDSFGGNAKAGRGGMIIAEVDESDGYFRNIASTCAVVTNVEREHMEHYGSFEDLVDAYREFVGRVSPEGVLIINGEDPVLRDIAGSSGAGKTTFGIDGDFDITCRDLTCDSSIEFDLLARGKGLGRISSPLIGRYNLMNILAAAAASLETGLEFRGIAEAVSSFRGVRRRFELVGRIGSIEVIEDYAHHPTELRAVIEAARNYKKGRVVTVFQPHRYSRTVDLMGEFSACFYGSDVLVLADIYSADEDAIEGAGIKELYNAIDGDRFNRIDVVEKNAIPEFVSGLVREDDTILVLGAGDIREIAVPIVERIKGK